MLKVLRVVTRPNHGGFHTHGTKTYLEDGKKRETYSRTFACICGEPMHDGDDYCEDLHDVSGVIVHANCRELAS